ncbi:MAG: MCE family protein [Gemmatimonadaceae bacterium]|nr:MCE family protein [Gemmatimonadaceae bacterium]NUR20802.1 MCE family protein [Gemmatimonadaceae bacterium]
MPRIQNWRSLLPGLLALAATVLFAVVVLTFARVGALHGSTIRVYSTMAEARGVMKGTPVWLNGQTIGQVARVDFLPPSGDTLANVAVVMDVLKKYARYVSADAQAQVRAGGTLIGAPVIYLSSASRGARLVHDGDTLRSLPQGDPEGVASQIALASRDFPAIIDNVKNLQADLATARGTGGALLNDDALKVDVVLERGTRLADRALHGGGTVDHALSGGATGAASRARSALARVDSLRTFMRSDRTVLGRFRRDSSLVRAVASLRDEVSIARALLDEPRGSAGRALHDSAATRQLSAAERELGVLLADLRAHPLRYVVF